MTIAGAAAVITLRNGTCERVRLTIVGMGEGPYRARDAERELTGKPLSNGAARDSFAAAAETVKSSVDAASDVHVSSGYRRHLAGVMAMRALETAFARAGGEL